MKADYWLAAGRVGPGLTDQGRIEQLANFLQTRRPKRSESGVRIRKPILSVFSSPLSDLGNRRVNPSRERKETMNPLIQLKQTTSVFLVAFGLASFGLSPKAQAVSPPPDGGYPG